MSQFQIIQYQEEHKLKVKELNHEWLEKYDLLEPLDDEYLDHPKEKILDRGGFILLAKVKDDIVGTAFFVPIDEGTGEICKLCVGEKWQNDGIGKALMMKCIEDAKKMNIYTIILYSNHKLVRALKMYEKMGFKLIEDDNEKYEESDIKMILKLISN